MFPSNTSGIYCPGCQPGDFQQQHICGFGSTGTAPQTIVWPWLTQPEPPRPCDHCFCLKLKAGYHDVGKPYNRHYLKRHMVCCMCETRRLKA